MMDSKSRLSKVQTDAHQTHMRQMLKDLGVDMQSDGVQRTPERYVQAMQFLTSGYQEDIQALLHKALFDVSYDEMVIVRDIEFYSLCEHHMLPFFGRCHIGYIPNGKILGLSKLPRLVNIFARRLQVQERLTSDVANALQDVLHPQGVGVVVEAHHLCMMMRGVEKQRSYTVTSSMTGCFRDQESTRKEFLNLIRMGRESLL